jgi:hypothetical protein
MRNRVHADAVRMIAASKPMAPAPAAALDALH